jgi:hypothetical protein
MVATVRIAWLPGLMLALCCSAAADSWAQDRVEVFGAVSVVAGAPPGTVVSDYSPALANGTLVRSSAGQTLTLNGDRGIGLQAGVNLFASRHVGVQVLVDRAHVDVSGANRPYSGSLEYVSVQPPASVPAVVTTAFAEPWPDTTGSLTQWTTCVNVLGRTAVRRVAASVSAGLGWTRLTADAQPLGHTAFALGGHSVLFSEEAHVAFALDAASAIGFNAGADVDVSLTPRVAVVAGYRYLAAKTVDMPVRLTAIANEDQLIFGTALADIAEVMRIAPARVRASGSRIAIGVKVRP